MALILPGNATSNTFQQDANVAVGTATKGAILLKFRYDPISSAFTTMQFNASQIGRCRYNASGDMTLRIQLDGENISGTALTSLVGGTTYVVAMTVDCDANEGKFFHDGAQVGSTAATTAATLGATTNGKLELLGGVIDGEEAIFVEAADWVGNLPTPTDISNYQTGTPLSSLSVPPTHSYAPTGDGTTYVSAISDTTSTNDMSHTQGPTTGGNEPVADGAPTGPTLTGPASAQEGDAINAIGTGLAGPTDIDLVTTVGGHVGAQVTTGVPTDTMWPYTVNPKTGVPFSVVPIQAAGVTLWVTEQRATDGTSATNVMTIAAAANETVIQGMIATSNTTPGESIFGTNILAMEDNLQANPPTLVDGVTITWFADGTFTVDMNQAISFAVDFFSPSNSEWQSISLNITEAGDIVVGDIINTKLSIGIGISI